LLVNFLWIYIYIYIYIYNCSYQKHISAKISPNSVWRPVSIRTRCGILKRSPDPLTGWGEPTYKGREWRRRGQRIGREGRGNGGRERGRKERENGGVGRGRRLSCVKPSRPQLHSRGCCASAHRETSFFISVTVRVTKQRCVTQLRWNGTVIGWENRIYCLMARRSHYHWHWCMTITDCTDYGHSS